jgi:hypothetical protein
MNSDKRRAAGSPARAPWAHSRPEKTTGLIGSVGRCGHLRGQVFRFILLCCATDWERRTCWSTAASQVSCGALRASIGDGGSVRMSRNLYAAPGHPPALGARDQAKQKKPNRDRRRRSARPRARVENAIRWLTRPTLRHGFDRVVPRPDPIAPRRRRRSKPWPRRCPRAREETTIKQLTRTATLLPAFSIGSRRTVPIAARRRRRSNPLAEAPPSRARANDHHKVNAAYAEFGWHPRETRAPNSPSSENAKAPAS